MVEHFTSYVNDLYNIGLLSVHIFHCHQEGFREGSGKYLSISSNFYPHAEEGVGCASPYPTPVSFRSIECIGREYLAIG